LRRSFENPTNLRHAAMGNLLGLEEGRQDVLLFFDHLPGTPPSFLLFQIGFDFYSYFCVVLSLFLGFYVTADLSFLCFFLFQVFLIFFG
jgi:hypothetical protein